MRIYVGNLSFKTTDEDLKALFETHGPVVSATVLKDKMSGESRGFGFVEMAEKAQADAAIAALNGQDFQGRALKVNEAKPQERSGGGGGGGRGGREGFGR